MENQELQKITDPRRNHYTVNVLRDKHLMKVFIKFTNRIRHPRVTFNLFFTGILLALFPAVFKGMALPAVIISYGMGVLLVLMAMFRHYISLSMMRNDPKVKEDVELTYRFGNRAIRVEQEGVEENFGYYNSVYCIWEDEEYYFLGMNEDDLLILPKNSFLEGEVQSFREFILKKSGADYRWVPVKFANVCKDRWGKIKAHIVQLRMQGMEKK